MKSVSYSCFHKRNSAAPERPTLVRRPAPLGIAQAMLQLLRLIDFVECYDRMRISRASPHFGRDPDSLHQFFTGSAFAERRPCVSFYAIRTLGNMRDRDRNDLLRSSR